MHPNYQPRETLRERSNRELGPINERRLALWSNIAAATSTTAAFIEPRAHVETTKSVVVLTTSLRTNSDRARAAFWRRMHTAMAASYELPEFQPKKIKWEAIRCSQCNARTYREAGDNGRHLCRGCDRAIVETQIRAISVRRGH